MAEWHTKKCRSFADALPTRQNWIVTNAQQENSIQPILSGQSRLVYPHRLVSQVSGHINETCRLVKHVIIPGTQQGGSQTKHVDLETTGLLKTG